MQRQLTDLELMTLLAILRVGEDAYGVRVAEEIERTGRRTVLMGAVYAVLDRLERYGLVSSSIGDPTPQRGGRAKRYFKVTPRGLRAVKDTQNALVALWTGVAPIEREAHMSSSRPPRMTTALLRRFASDNEPLIGDLLERYSARPSRLWFWQQVIAALAIRMFQHADQRHPLGIAGSSEAVSDEQPPQTELPRHVNLSASPIPGIGGLGLVALGVIVAMARPTAWWIFVPAIAGGVALGLTMVLVRRHAMLSGAPETRRTLLSDIDAAGGPDKAK